MWTSDAALPSRPPILPQGPPDSPKEMTAKARVTPNFGTMTKRGVENAATTALAPPRQYIVSIPTLALGDVNRGWIEAQEHMHVVACPAPELVDLVGDLERRPEVLRGRVSRVLDLDPNALVPRVSIEVCAQTFPIGGGVIPGIRGAVDANQAAPSTHAGQQRDARLRRH